MIVALLETSPLNSPLHMRRYWPALLGIQVSVAQSLGLLPNDLLASTETLAISRSALRMATT